MGPGQIFNFDGHSYPANHFSANVGDPVDLVQVKFSMDIKG